MKTINSFRSKLFAFTLALMASVSTFAYDFQSGYLFYNILPDRTVAVTSETYGIPYDYLPTSLVIPSEVSDYYGAKYQVSEIANGAFQGCDELESVIIPNTVKKIGMYAFTGCSKLIDISFPESLEDVMGGALYDCAWYNNQPDGLVYVGNLLYRYKGTAPAGTIEVREGTKAILDLAFSQQSNIQSVVLPSSVTSVHLRAFANCANLETIVLPDSLSVIDDEAFTNCVKLTAIKLPQILSIIGEGAFSGCSNLSQIEWPQHMISIGASAFYECTQLDNVEAIPASIQKIGANAFYNTAWENRQPAGYLYIHNIFYAYTGELTDNLHINIKHGTTYISGGAVSHCWLTNYRENVVTKLTIPTTVREIEDRTFASCNKLDTIICAADMVPVIGENTFSTKTYENSKLLVFDYLLTFYQYGDFWRNFVNIQPITDYSSFNPKTFMSDGFYYNIINDTIAPFEVEVTYTWGAMDNMSQKNYTELTEANIPATVEYKGKVFNVTRIGEWAFGWANKLQRVAMGENIKTIDRFAIMNCPQLKEVQIGKNVDSILIDAFSYGKLETISIPKNVKYIAPLIVRNNPIKSIVVDPDNVNYTSVDGVLFNKQENILHSFPAAKATEYVIPETVDTIGSCAFSNAAITSVIFPKTLVYIEPGAFFNTKLTKLDFPSTLMAIGMTAFDMCSGITEVTCRATTPPIMSDGQEEYNTSVFLRVPIANATLYVPAESVEAYKSASQWKDFGQILPIEPTSYKSQWCDTWNMLVQTGSVYPPSSTPYRYQLAKDTVIGDYTYTAIVSKVINDALDAPHYVAAVRFTDDRKVYIYYDNAEYLLYDFNVQQGDELEVFAGINNYRFGIKTYKCIVTGVEQYACIGCPATITLHVPNHPDDFTEIYRRTQWQEGVGDVYSGFLNGVNGYVPVDGGGSVHLLCAYQGNELKHTGPFYEEYGCGDDAEQSPADLFPTLWGLQRTSCTKTIGEDEEGTVHGLRSTLMKVKQDMIIDGKQYVLFGEGHNYDSFLLREKGNKVFVYSSLLRKDLVLYDYTLEVGDSLPALYIDWQYHDAFHQPLPYNGEVVDYNKDYDGTILPADTFIVTNISTITLLDGKEHKKWTFNNGMQYVEGIGSYGTSYDENDFYQLIANVPQYSDADSTFLVCASKNGKLLYQMDDAEMERLGAECLCDVETSYKDQWCDTWNIMSFDGMVFESSVETDQYKLAQDTIIGEYVYTALTRQPTSSGTNPTSYVAAVRFTEDKKVYIFYDNTEYLLYDFDVQVGDVLETFVGINHYGPWNTCYYAVTGIEEIPEDGTKKIHLEAYVIDDEAESFVIETTWIEGVGSTDGFVMSPLGLGGIVGNSNYKLLCAYKDNELEYTSTWYNEYGCQCNANEINDSFYPTLAGLQRTSFYEHGEDCSANYAQLMISNRTMRIGSNYYLRFDDTPYGTLFLREYHNRVFVYSFADQRDLILYDWNLQVGDSMTYRSIDNYSYPDSEYPVVVNYMARSHSDGTITKEPLGKIYVTNISTVTLLDGNEYKKWTFNNGMEYIQGLGCMDGNYFSLIIPEAVPTCYRADHLVCASKNGQLLYQMDDAEMERLDAECLCEYNSGPRRDNAKNGKIGGRPTPTQWNMLEVVLQETEVGNTILRAETFSYTLEDDSIVANGKTFYQLARQSTKDTATTKSFVGALHFGEGEDNRVYFLHNGVEYVLYDFTAEPGDTVEIFAGINNYPHDSVYTHVVTGKDTLENGACRMLLEVVFPEETNVTATHAEKIWLAGLGSVDGIVHNAAKRTSNAHAAPSRSASSSEAQTSVMLCAWREDSCLYTTDHPDYNELGCEYNQDPTAVEDIYIPQTTYKKIIRNGQLLIIHEDKTYNVMGIEVK